MSDDAQIQQGRLFGLLNIDKPPGWSSRDVVSYVQQILRRSARREKVGHAGTLDPLATGVLVIGVGPATRLVEYIQRLPKRYVATFLLGRRSDTEDIEGEVTTLESPPIPTADSIQTAKSRFIGRIEQTPPRFSAIKIGGRRAYKMARAGETVTLLPRPIRVDAIEVVKYAYPELVLDIKCGGGTYVRSLGRDLAESLGTAAVMSALRRAAIGAFAVETAVSPEILTAETLPHHLINPLDAVLGMPQRMITPQERIRLSNGQSIAHCSSDAAANPTCDGASGRPDEWAAVDGAGRLVAILARREDGLLWPLRNFASS